MAEVDERTLEEVLTRHQRAEDAAVLDRRTSVGDRERVCYLVIGRSSEAEEVVAEAVRGIGVDSSGIIGVPVSCLPLDPEGRLYTPALEAVPVVDGVSTRAWEEQVRAALGTGMAAVVPVERTPPAKPLHLSDVAPEGWGVAGRTEPAPEAVPSAVRAEGATAAVPAVSHGDQLRALPGSPRTLLDTLRRAAERSSDRSLRYVHHNLALETQSYAELLADAERVLGGLRRIGLVPGDRVILQLGQHRDFLAALWGCMLGGVIPVPVAIAPGYREPNAVTQRLAAAWEMLGRPLVLTTPELLADVNSLGSSLSLEGFCVASLASLREGKQDPRWHPARPDEVALIMLTSGSTGTPKGVKLTHANLVARSLGSEQMNGFTRDEVTLNWMPLEHVAGILFFHLRDVFLGCDQIHVPTDIVLGDPLRWMELIHEHRCTITFAPNFAYGLVNDRAELIRERSWDLSSLKCFLNGAEAIVPRTARRFLNLLIPHGLRPSAMWPAWGMSETSSGVTYSHRFSLELVRDADEFVEVGRPIPGVSLRIVDDAGRAVTEGTTGNLEVSGATLMAGYYDSSLDSDAFSPDGWFKTGDLAVIRDGCLTITGRAKDVIIINSVNYYSHALESVAEEVPGVATSFVAACPVRAPGDDTDHLAIIFNAEIGSDTELLDVFREIRQRLVRKVGVNPDYLIPVEKADIPKTEIGKIQRPLLAQRFAAGVFDDERRRVDLLMGGERTIPDWFFRRSWVRSERRRAGAAGQPGTWVVFVDDTGLGDAVCEEILRRGEPVLAVKAGSRFAPLGSRRWVIDPADPAHYERVLAEFGDVEPPISRTVHMWTVGDVSSQEPGRLLATLERGVLSLLSWIQALAAASTRADEVEVLAVATRAQSVREGEEVDGAKAAVLGLLKSAPQELSWLRCRHLDLVPEDRAANADTVLDEALHGAAEREVAYRDGRRFGARLANARPTTPPASEPPLRRGGTYLLTGGLGGIGFEVARHLLQRFDARLLLVGRSDPGRDPELRKRLEGLNGRGDAARYARVDVGDLEGLQGAVGDAEQSWGRPLDGVFHLAGVYRERALLDESPESFLEVLHPKVVGSWALGRLLAERPDACFLGFSSVSAAFGGALVSAYASANVALEAFTAGVGRRGGAARACASWSTWEDIGISRDFAGTALLRAKGYMPVTLPLGLTSMLSTLARSEPVLYVGLDGSSPNVRRHLNSPVCARLGVDVFFTDEAGLGALAAIELKDRFGTAIAPRLELRAELPMASDGSIDRTALAEGRGRAAADAELQTATSELEHAIARVWKTTLRRERIDVRDNFFDLGGNSLLLSQACSALSAEFGKPLSLTDMFQYSTVRTLARHLGGGPTPAAEGLDATISRGTERMERIRARRKKPRS